MLQLYRQILKAARDFPSVRSRRRRPALPAPTQHTAATAATSLPPLGGPLLRYAAAPIQPGLQAPINVAWCAYATPQVKRLSIIREIKAEFRANRVSALLQLQPQVHAPCNRSGRSRLSLGPTGRERMH